MVRLIYRQIYTTASDYWPTGIEREVWCESRGKILYLPLATEKEKHEVVSLCVYDGGNKEKTNIHLYMYIYIIYTTFFVLKAGVE